jgi:hypothetical protein
MTRVAAALLLLASLACATTKRAEHGNLCSGSQTRCNTEEVCAEDKGRGCWVCACREPDAGPQKPSWVPDVPGPPPPAP